MKAEQLTDPVVYHGEGPVWSDAWGGLRWVDMLDGDILSLGPDGSIDRRHVADIAAIVRPRRGGGAVLGIERGFAFEEPDGSIRRLGDLWDDDDVRMNEGGCDPDGRFYCGSMAYDQHPGAGSLYRLDAAGEVEVVLEQVTISNGLDWSPDDSLAYYIDTPTHEVSVFDYDSDRGLRGRRTFVEIPADNGGPDGLAVDEEGGIWVALFGGSAVHRYTDRGKLDEVVEVEARQVTACCFGGPNLDRLFITTSRERLEPDDDPLAGSLFTTMPGVAGLPVRDFAG
ncbi:MAG TPA: SMP-30/gluconolactonase/LRE family protein [Acidimicrobiia bacterium]|nr:SMP-30/gluconolactonase/LRE family protein [Acidimicrobiia bacterium]